MLFQPFQRFQTFQSIHRLGQPFASPNDPVRSHQHIRWNRQTDLLRRFEIDDELELLRLLHGKVRGLAAFQNLVHVGGGAPELGVTFCPVNFGTLVVDFGQI